MSLMQIISVNHRNSHCRISLHSHWFFSLIHSSQKTEWDLPGSRLLQGRPPQFQVPKTNPVDMARCCSESNTKISKCGNTSLYFAKFWRVQRCIFFSAEKQNLCSLLFTFPKVASLHSGFSLSVFRSKIREINHTPIPSELVCLRPYPPQFLKYGYIPAPLRTSNKGGPNSKNHISFRCPKNEPKTSLSYLLVLLMTLFPFLASCRWKNACKWGALRLGDALAEATPRTQNVLAQGQSEAHGDSKLYNTIVWKHESGVAALFHSSDLSQTTQVWQLSHSSA